MRLVIIGCEYSGTTTLASSICRWAENAMGGKFEFHDHWKFPHIGFDPIDHSALVFDEKEQKEILSLTPVMKEQAARYNLVAHEPTESTPADHILVGFHFDDTVYSSLYWAYGAGDEVPFIDGGPRSDYSRDIEEKRMLKYMPDCVLVLLKASPEIIAKRMQESPHKNGVLKKKDIDYVIQRFDEEYEASLITHKFTLDTSESTVEETLNEFLESMDPFFTETDKLRINSHAAFQNHTANK